MSDIAYKNTDREIWRAKPGDFYSDSVHVTEGGGIGINVGGTVIVRTPSEWHQLDRDLKAALQVLSDNDLGMYETVTMPIKSAVKIDRLTRELAEARRERDEAKAEAASIFESFKKMDATNEQTFQNWRKSVARAEKLRLHMYGHTAECSECKRLLGLDRAAQLRPTDQ